MVDQGLLAEVMKLDESTRRELRDAIDDSLDNAQLSAEIALLIDDRISESVARASDSVTLDEDEREVRAR
ncbi:MAG: hypothetical protein KF844_01875 [Cryobacterium sp.]|nr:hypothetical protein [Cryobacterium sp.]